MSYYITVRRRPPPRKRPAPVFSTANMFVKRHNLCLHPSSKEFRVDSWSAEYSDGVRAHSSSADSDRSDECMIQC